MRFGVGTVECSSPVPSKEDQEEAAVNIALSRASIILSSDYQPLPPFRRDANHTCNSVVIPELVTCDSIRNE
ncbi:hypothetical protein G9A89_013944 [Geosiphon pyriformis]|nr:hypothetical protein G9A89_013944 [Geosiphon pyriformis]